MKSCVIAMFDGSMQNDEGRSDRAGFAGRKNLINNKLRSIDKVLNIFVFLFKSIKN
jgi:hypothetical protein